MSKPAFVEMAEKDCTDCILDGTDACTRGAGRAVDDEICKDFIESEDKGCYQKMFIEKDGDRK